MISETQMEALPKSRHEAQLVDRLQESLVAAESQSKRNYQSNLFYYLGPDPKVNVADSAPDDRYGTGTLELQLVIGCHLE
jgi:hypothetical protein